MLYVRDIKRGEGCSSGVLGYASRSGTLNRQICIAKKVDFSFGLELKCWLRRIGEGENHGIMRPDNGESRSHGISGSATKSRVNGCCELRLFYRVRTGKSGSNVIAQGQQDRRQVTG